MTLSKITFAVLALGFSFGPALAESGETNPRLTAPVVDMSSSPMMEGRQAAPLVTGTTDAERYVIDRNGREDHGR